MSEIVADSEIVSDHVAMVGGELYTMIVQYWRAMDGRPPLYEFALDVSEHFAMLMGDEVMLRELGSDSAPFA
ncbi:hypothetical protein [Cryobacterium sp. CG_9.6]|uniref:hypothetical protein n=1 Tax=Cryobacterium sp. CG_9.6 TaxID=2760710 RepID=UPI00247521F9|nr:hypothetical protein [Cryobacterium sp. CG_9.6]MDH6237903.1 hypothetical protein [Cryobacterium sp. CG_9.6]